MLKVSVKLLNDLAVIETSGIVQRRNEEELIRMMNYSIEKGANALLFDWSDVTYFDSMGLEGLISVYKKSQKHPGLKLGILITDKVLQEVYRTLRFQKIVPLYTNFDQAVKCLQGKTEEITT